MSKISLDRLKQKYPHILGEGKVKGGIYRALMTKIIAHNTEQVSKKVAKISKDTYTKQVDKMSGKFKRLAVPDISDVLPKRSVFMRKAADKGNLITDALRDKLTKDLREIIAKPEYTRRRGALTGTLKASAIKDFEESIKQTFQNYTKRDPKIGVPKNVHTIAVTEIRSVTNQIRNEYTTQLVKNNPEIEARKVWKHNGRLVKEPRQSHRDLDGVEIGSGELFEVLDEQSGRTYMAEHPHAEGLPPSSVIGCQCECQYFVRVKEKNNEVQKALEIGHISHRKDGDYKKIGEGEWVKVSEGGENKTETSGENKKEKLDISTEESYSENIEKMYNDRFDELAKTNPDKLLKISQSCNMYTGGQYEYINGLLTGKKTADDMTSKTYEESKQHIENLKEYISEFKIDRDIKLYRGIFLDSVPESGNSISIDGFMSSSSSKDTAEYFSGRKKPPGKKQIVMEFTAKAGSQFAPASQGVVLNKEEGNKYYFNSNEQEFIGAPNQKLNIKSITEKNGIYYAKAELL